MGPLAATLFALKTGASSGFVTGLGSVTWQQLTRSTCCRKTGDEDEDEEERAQTEALQKHLDPRSLISVKDALESFAIGAVTGTLIGGFTWQYTLGKGVPHAWYKSLRAILVGELVWLPVVASCVAGTANEVEDAMPIVFVCTMVGLGGGLLIFEGLRAYKVVVGVTDGLLNAGDMRRALWFTGAPSTAFLLVLFAAKMGEFQRQKELMFDTRRVRVIQLMASYGGQLSATICSLSAVTLPWLPPRIAFAPWFMPSLIISPLFLYCTALNIENGVMSKEVVKALASEKPEDVQQRRSTMQILPVGLLPFAWTKGRESPVFVKIAFGGFALLCASAYIGCQIVPWRIYLKRQRMRQKTRSDAAEGWFQRHTSGLASPSVGLGLGKQSTNFVSASLGVNLNSNEEAELEEEEGLSASKREELRARKNSGQFQTLEGEQC